MWKWYLSGRIGDSQAPRTNTGATGMNERTIGKLKNLGRCIALCSALLFPSGQAHAAAVSWNLQNVGLLDGGTVTGFLVFDADTETFSDFSFTLSASPEFGVTAETLTPANSTILTANEHQWYLYDPSTLNAFEFCTQPGCGPAGGLYQSGPAYNLSDSGGTVPLFGNSSNPRAATAVWNYNVCCSADYLVSSGSLVATGSGSATPEPNAVILLSMGLLAIGGFRRRASRSWRDTTNR